jgi:hypothetical protein
MLTIANSVPAERAFSTMNFTKSKLRNRLSAERTALLCFIFINCRVLEREDRTILAFTDDELDQMEEDLAVLAEEDESSEEEQDVVLRSRPGHWTAESQDLGQAIPVSFPNVHQGEYLAGSTPYSALSLDPGKVDSVAGQKRPASQDLQVQFRHWKP